MTNFTVTITRIRQLSGIAAARYAHNAAVSVVECETIEAHPGFIATGAAYMHFGFCWCGRKLPELVRGVTRAACFTVGSDSAPTKCIVKAPAGVILTITAIDIF